MDSQTIPDELVTCIAVKGDRHQNFMSSVILMKGIEEPLLGYKVCAIRREGAGETNTIRTVEQNESQMQVRSVAGSAVCFVETAEGVFRAREVRRIEHQDRWDKEAINNVIGVSWRIADEKKKDSGQASDAN